MMTPSRNVFKNLFVFFCCCVLNGHVVESNCRSSLRCISITECSPFVHLAKNSEKPLHPSIVQFLRSQQCDFAGGYPKVCCSQVPEHLSAFMRKETKLKSHRREGKTIEESVGTKRAETEDEKMMKKFSSVVGSSFFDLVGYNYREKRGKKTRENIDVEIR